MKEDAATALVRSVPSDLAKIDVVCDEAALLLRRSGQDEHVFGVTLLLREFMNNAILHGHGSDAGKRVRVQVRVGRRWIVVRVADEGPGFDWRKAKREVPDETRESGRGLAIGAVYSERMRFNKSGNEITLWIRKTV